MRSYLLAAVGVCLLFSACNSSPPAPLAGNGKPSGDPEVTGDLAVGQPIQFENLTIFPVTSKAARNQDRFITLDEGLKAGTVEIVEVGAAQGNAEPQVQTDDAQNPPPPTSAAPTEDSPEENDAADNAEGAAPAAARSPAVGQSQGDTGEALIRDSDFEGLTPASAESPQAEPRAVVDPDEVVEPQQPQRAVEPQGEAAAPPSQSQAVEPSSQQRIDPWLNNLAQQQLEGVGGGGNEVNRLMVVNRSDRPLYLMPGEIIVGGSQDRTIAQELVIANDGKPMPIEVFCVEQGRWGGREAGATADLISMAQENVANAGSVTVASPAPAQAGEQASQGKFVASVGNLGKEGRVAVQHAKQQGEVWDKVASANAKSGVQVESGAFTHNYIQGDAVERLEPYIEKLQGPVDKTQRVVGVIVAINGKVESVDVFESTPLFRKLWPKLLKSYAFDAANSSEEQEAAAVCTQADAWKFMNDAASAQVASSETKQGVLTVHRANERIVSFSASDPAAADSANSPAAKVEFGGAVHSSAFAQ